MNHLERIWRIEHFIECNLQREFNIRELSEVAHLSYHHLQHVFAGQQQQSLWNYVKQYRLKYAAGLLRHSAYSIQDIAELTGYGGVYSFSKAFAGSFETSPNRFRKDQTQIHNGHRMCFVTDEKKTIEALESSNRVYHEAADHYYTRISTLLSLETHPAVQQVFGLAATYFIDLSQTHIVANSPDVYIMTDPVSMRINFGFMAKKGVLPEQLRSVLLHKAIEPGWFLHKQLSVPADSTGFYAFEIIEMASRFSFYKIRNHNTMASISLKDGQPVVELMIPVT